MSVAGLKDISLTISNNRNVELIELDMSNGELDELIITKNAALVDLDTKLENLAVKNRLTIAGNNNLRNVFPKTAGLSLPTGGVMISNAMLINCRIVNDDPTFGEGMECDSFSDNDLKLDPVTKAKCA